eukprot:1196297-Prorocentrum_minimum.AAC.12
MTPLGRVGPNPDESEPTPAPSPGEIRKMKILEKRGWKCSCGCRVTSKKEYALHNMGVIMGRSTGASPKIDPKSAEFTGKLSSRSLKTRSREIF